MPILGPMGIDTHWIRHKSQFIEHGIFEVDRFLSSVCDNALAFVVNPSNNPPKHS